MKSIASGIEQWSWFSEEKQMKLSGLQCNIQLYTEDYLDQWPLNLSDRSGYSDKKLSSNDKCHFLKPGQTTDFAFPNHIQHL